MNSYFDQLKVKCAESCGNSPKKELLKELTIAFAKNDNGFCLEWMKDDVIWDIIGERCIQGTDEFEDALVMKRDREAEELLIDNIITHGNTGSVNGTLIFADKSRTAFCDVYNFAGFGKNAKVKKICSYRIPL